MAFRSPLAAALHAINPETERLTGSPRDAGFTVENLESWYASRAGHDGGRIVFEGAPADLVTGRSTLTGEHLAAYVGA